MPDAVIVAHLIPGAPPWTAGFFAFVLTIVALDWILRKYVFGRSKKVSKINTKKGGFEDQQEVPELGQ